MRSCTSCAAASGAAPHASSCVLLYRSPLSQLARARLKVIRETNDGFEIARHDLALRGPGELLGTRQTGLAQLRVADLIARCRSAAARAGGRGAAARYPDHIAPLAARWTGDRRAICTRLGMSGTARRRQRRYSSGGACHHRLARRLEEYGRLVRLDRPIGIWLLLWPTLWALWVAGAGHRDPRVLVIFVAGRRGDARRRLHHQ